MSDFPHEAIITPVLSESMHEAFARCIICQEVPDIVYQVDIPPKWIDDETIRHPVSTTCCSEQHALEYEQKKEPRTRKKDRRISHQRQWIQDGLMCTGNMGTILMIIPHVMGNG